MIKSIRYKMTEKKLKRFDIDYRLMAMQAKIDAFEIFNKIKHGHGKFDFSKMCAA